MQAVTEQPIKNGQPLAKEHEDSGHEIVGKQTVPGAPPDCAHV